MQEIIKRQKKGETKGGRQKEREEEGKYCSSVPSKHEMLGYFNKKKVTIHMGVKETLRKGGRESESKIEARKQKVKVLSD